MFEKMIRELITDFGTEKSLAEALGIDQSTVNRWLHGKSCSGKVFERVYALHAKRSKTAKRARVAS